MTIKQLINKLLGKPTIRIRVDRQTAEQMKNRKSVIKGVRK